MATGIVIGGKTIQVGPDWRPIVVLGPEDHGIEFKVGVGHNRRRVETIRACVWHWTGGERAPEKMAQVLARRGYGVEFAISTMGLIYQFADPLKVDTADVGGFNAPSVGVEMVNIGYRRPKGWGWIPNHREAVKGRLHGVRRTFASFTPRQLRAACFLADALSETLPIARLVPCNDDDEVITSTIGDLDTFSGHLGHYHVTKRKIDPGPVFMQDLDDYFRRRPDNAQDTLSC